MKFLKITLAIAITILSCASAQAGGGWAGPLPGSVPWGAGVGQAPIPGYLLIAASSGAKFLVTVGPYVAGAGLFIYVTQKVKEKIETPEMINAQMLQNKMNDCFRNAIHQGLKGKHMAALNMRVQGPFTECVHNLANTEGLKVTKAE